MQVDYIQIRKDLRQLNSHPPIKLSGLLNTTQLVLVEFQQALFQEKT